MTHDRSGVPVTRTAWALVGDLFGRGQVASLARADDMSVRFFARAEPLLAALDADAGSPPDLAIVDLGAGDAAWSLLESLAARRADGGAVPPVLAFYAHVEDETRRRALALGADRVVPRSAFVKGFARWRRELTAAAGP